jgi:hypothetical protein
MGAPDASAQAAIAASTIHPVFVGYLDILGDPIRVTTAPYGVTFSGTNDTDLDGQTFDAIDGTFIGVSPVQNKEGGASTVTVTLSGLIGIDSDLLNQIGNKANWQGRTARLWQMMYDAGLQRVGNIWPFYTGYMSVPRIVGDATQQTIVLEVESYLAFLKQASGRSYLIQNQYDAGDFSAEASIAVANGTNLIPGGSSRLDQLGGLGGLFQ